MLTSSIAARLSVCAVTVRHSSLAQQMQAIARAGCKGIGIFHPMVPAGTHASEVRSLLDAHGLQASICVPNPFTLLPTRMFSAAQGRTLTRGTEPPASEDDFMRSLRWLAELRPACVVLIPGAQAARSAQEAWELAVHSAIRVARVAADLGITLAVEPIHPRFSSDFSIVSDIDTSLRFIEDVGMENLGVLIESFQVWQCVDLQAQIKRAAGRIAGVQLSDSTPFPRSLLDRLPPGEGVIDLAGIVKAIEDTGYRGWYDVEVVSDDGSLGYAAYPDSVWRRPTEELVHSCVAGAAKALSMGTLG